MAGVFRLVRVSSHHHHQSHQDSASFWRLVRNLVPLFRRHKFVCVRDLSSSIPMRPPMRCNCNLLSCAHSLLATDDACLSNWSQLKFFSFYFSFPSLISLFAVFLDNPLLYLFLSLGPIGPLGPLAPVHLAWSHLGMDLGTL